MQPFFIAAPGTGVGKTFVTTALCWQLQQAGKKVAALKPIISGYDPGDEQSDTALILKSRGIAPTKAAIEAISPWRFALPLAPDMAAAKEGKSPVELEKLVNFCRSVNPLSLWERVAPKAPGEGGAGATLTSPHPNPLPEGEGIYKLIETIGGVMTPINDHDTVLDWMAALGWPVILVTGNYLGSISHTLMALEVLHARRLPVKGLVVSESESGVLLEDTVTALKKFVFATIPVVEIPRIACLRRSEAALASRRQAAQGDLWKHTPDISWICA